jgi:hypothetical protein
MTVRTRIRRLRDVLLVVAIAAALPLAGMATAQDGPPVCAPEGDAVELSGTVTRDDAKTYKILPFEVAAGTTRVEVGYEWADEGLNGSPPPPSTPLTQTVFDLGLWDNDGYRAVDGFRGWSGSRQGKLHDGQDPIWVQADSADRSYAAGAVEPGTWFVELGVAAVGPNGASWRVEVTCSAPAVGEEPTPDPVDPNHVARADTGWYHGDFHMHAFHSSPTGPSWDELIGYARDAKLDFLPITEYVVGHHWDQLGSTQRANPDLVIWPGREIITYFGHVNTLNETPNVIEYRHGFEDITITGIQQAAVEDGALFQINHPTTFAGPAFENFCRGCGYDLKEDTDWANVDTIEVLTGPVIVDPTQVGGPPTPRGMENPFLQPAIDLWDELLLEGHKITAVSGSDDKAGPGLGMNATAVHAAELSRPALVEAVRAGRAYVRTRGVDESPALDLEGVAGEETGTFGDTFAAEEVEVTVTVTGGAGQLLNIYRDGRLAGTAPVTDDDFTHTFTADRSDDSGPLGTYWRVETLDDRSRTTISNPIFLAGGVGGEPEESADEHEGQPGDGSREPTEPGPSRDLPATGSAAVAGGLLALAGALCVRCLRR